MRFAITLLIGGFAFGLSAEVKNPRTSPADVAAGAKIFRGHCAECHGLKGEGGRGPNLTTGVFFHGSSDEDLFRNITNGIPGTAMPDVFFSAEQVWQVVAFVRTLSQRGSPSPPTGDRARGAAMFRERGCGSCHLVRGEGSVNGPDLSVIGSQRSVEHLRQAILDPNANVAREYWVAKVTLASGAAFTGFLMNEDTYTIQLLDFSKGLKSVAKRDVRKFEVDKSSTMPAYKGQMNERDVADVVAYLWSLKRAGSSE